MVVIWSIFEVARTEMIRQAGFSYRDLEESGIMLPVIHSEIQYKQPIFYDERMDIRVLLFDTPSVRLNTYYEIRTEEGKKAAYTGSGYAGFYEYRDAQTGSCA